MRRALALVLVAWSFTLATGAAAGEPDALTDEQKRARVLEALQNVPSAVPDEDAIPEIEHPVTDLVQRLTPDQVEAVSEALAKLRADHGVHMAVVLTDHTAAPLEDYAQQIFDAWEGGDPERQQGLLFVLALGDRKSRLHTGYGMEATIPDAVARRMLDALRPELRGGDIAGACLKIVDLVRSAAAGETIPDPSEARYAEPATHSTYEPDHGCADSAGLITIFVLLGFFVLILVAAKAGAGGGGGTWSGTSSGSSSSSSWTSSSWTSSSSSWSSSSSSSSSSGSYSSHSWGGGGGSSGGGGASSSW